MNKAEILDKILHLRHIDTLLSNFIDIDIGSDSRVYTSYSFVETGRLASAEDELGRGSHLQNIPSQVRRMYIADEGKLLVEADKKQGEAMIVAWLADETRMKEVFKSGGDVHKRNASYIFNKPESAITSEERYLAKRMVHATNYGMSTNTMAIYCNISELDAKKAQSAYFAAFPRILTWQREVREQVSKTSILTNCFGRRRIFFERVGEELFREAYAYNPQSTLVDDVNRSMVEIFFRGEPELQLLHQGHDSLLWQVDTQKASWAVGLIKKYMELPFFCGSEMIAIPVEIKVGRSWGELENV